MTRPQIMNNWMNCALLTIGTAHVVMALQTPSVFVPRTLTFTFTSAAISSSSSSSPSLVTLGSTVTSTPDFSGSFDSHQMDELAQRGELEASFMQDSVGELEQPGKKISKKKKKQKKKEKGPSIPIIARTLREEGVVRLNGVLSPISASTLREEILERRTAAYDAISRDDENINDVNDDDDGEWRKYFADVLLKENRCDLLLPLKGSNGIQTALHEILVSSNVLSNILVTALGGDDATLYELAALISEPGSPRQPVHPDNPHQEHTPLLTVFIALQDIASPMGPTTFIPKTHTAASHAKFDDISQRDAFLQNSSSVVALLKSGDASLFDSRTMHCGGANDELHGATRVLLYASFRNPRATESIGNVGSLMKGIKPMTLRELKSKLAASVVADTSVDPFDDEREEEEAIRQNRLAAEEGDSLAQLQLGTNYYLGEGGVEVNHAEAVHWFELAAAQGLAHAQFNLGFCLSTGVGVVGEVEGISAAVSSRQDLERAAELFRLAAEQGHQGAKEAYIDALSECKKMQI